MIARHSPPKPYGSLHIPLVASRHPLWDDFEEDEDHDFERTLDQGRLTPTTTWLDAEPEGIATIPEESIAPLIMSLALLFFFVAFALPDRMGDAYQKIIVTPCMVSRWPNGFEAVNNRQLGRDVSICAVTQWPAIGMAALHRFGESQRVGSSVILQREVSAEVTEPFSNRRGARLRAMP